MHISLIVTTLNRPTELARLLHSLAVQKFKDFEIILVDQNKEPTVIDETLGLNCRVQHLGMPCGASAARNAGLALATGDVIAFPDDDCSYMPDTLSSVNTFFSQHPEYGGVVAKWKSPKRGRIGRYGVFRQAGTCFYFLRRKWVQAIGEFDPTFGPGGEARWQGGEDTDYLIRGLEKGMSLYREPSIIVQHPEMDWAATMKQKVISYGVARMALLRKHHYPFWFRLGMVLYPLASLFLHPSKATYYFSMFRGRVQGFMLSMR